MAEAKLTEVKIEITLKLTEHEAEYLKAELKTARHTRESDVDFKTRTGIHDALNGVLFKC